MPIYSHMYMEIYLSIYKYRSLAFFFLLDIFICKKLNMHVCFRAC